MSLKSDLPFVSVIIPTYNEGWHIRECLESMCNQDYPRHEVILVDNGSTDDTASICREFPVVRYVYFDGSKSSYAARNEGVRHARGEVLAFFDADQTARPDYLRRLLSDYAPDDPYHVYWVLLEDDSRIPGVLRTFFSPSPRTRTKIGTSASAVPRKLFDELGGFNERLLSGGDFEFFDRAMEIAQVHRCYETGGYHYWARGVGELLAREERYSFGRCLRNHNEGRKPPGLLAEALRLLSLTCRKAVAALLVPLRYPRAEWSVRWRVQQIDWLMGVRRITGIAKYRLGFRRAGDLPWDANARRVAGGCPDRAGGGSPGSNSSGGPGIGAGNAEAGHAEMASIRGQGPTIKPATLSE